jgi:polyisoprenoid-binding protein YceI
MPHRLRSRRERDPHTRFFRPLPPKRQEHPMTLRPLFAALVLSALATPALADTYSIDAGHTQVRIQYNHLGFSNIVGLFTGVEGTLTYDAADPAKSSVSAKIPVTTLLTGVTKLDQHLQSDEFFDVAKFPHATFTSTKVEAGADGALKIHGDLEIHGVKKPVVLDAKLNKQGEHPMAKVPAVGFDATTTFKRSDFGVGLYAPNVSDEVTVEITLEARVAAKE